MDDLIKAALSEEAAEAPFPADAWQRQAALLTEAGLIGGPAGAPPAKVHRRRSRWGEVAVAAAVVLLAFGGLRLQVEAPAPLPQGVGGPTEPAPPSTAWFDAAGALQLPSVDQFQGIRIPQPNGFRRFNGNTFYQAQWWGLLSQFLTRGQIVERLSDWNSTELPALEVELAGGLRIFLYAGPECRGPYDPAACYTIVRLPTGDAIKIVSQDLSYLLDGWEPGEFDRWNGARFQSAEGYRLTEEQAGTAAQAALARDGHPSMLVESARATLRYQLKRGSEGEYHLQTEPAWYVILHETGTSEGRATAFFTEAVYADQGAFPLSLNYYADGDVPGTPAEGRPLAEASWQIDPMQVIGVQPVQNIQKVWERPDPKVAALLPKLLGWLGEAEVVQESIDLTEVEERFLYLHLEGGERIWFARHFECLRYVERDCSFVVGGDGRPTTLVAQPDLWRWLVGMAWQQELMGVNWPTTGRYQWMEPLRMTRAEVEAMVLAAAADLRIYSIEVQPRYSQRQEPDGRWRIDESPLWIIHLEQDDPNPTHGEIRMIDDATGELVWQQATTIDRSASKP